ncbi:hypothetical protein [Okeania sp.]|uniref:hypothetical protein n=1 Tax=Okeania sp. TaxID=3100323 RepID=UPI002B4B6CAE|nr:hypothetical protein [Okeania sp.]MEB3339759.1 hypothetical protein [Okeania sp.]
MSLLEIEKKCGQKNLQNFRLAKIDSIQINNNSWESIEITNETEVGFKFDIDAKKG